MRIFPIALTCAALIAPFGLTAATITTTHTATVLFADNNGTEIARSEQSATQTGFNMPDYVSAQMQMPGHDKFGRVALQGNGQFEMEGIMGRIGRLTVTSNITIEVTPEIVSSGPAGDVYEELDLSVGAIVDGGALSSIDSANALMRFDLNMLAISPGPIIDAEGGVAILEYNGARQPRLTSFGDVGFSPLPNQSGGDILLSLLSTTGSVGGLNRPDPFTLEYTAEFKLFVDDDGFTEGLSFWFQDPLQLGGSGPQQTINLDIAPSAAPIPLPAGIWGLLCAMGCLGAARRFNQPIG